MKYLLLAAVALIMSYCSPVATYPPIEVESAVIFSNANFEPVPTILVTTIEYAHDHFGGLETVVYNLPVGVGSETYDIVTSRVKGAKPLQENGQQAYHITELRVRGFKAEANITFPGAGGYESATLYLSKTLSSPWKVTRERVWLIPDVEVPVPNYVGTKQAVIVDTE